LWWQEPPPRHFPNCDRHSFGVFSAGRCASFLLSLRSRLFVASPTGSPRFSRPTASSPTNFPATSNAYFLLVAALPDGSRFARASSPASPIGSPNFAIAIAPRLAPKILNQGFLPKFFPAPSATLIKYFAYVHYKYNTNQQGSNTNFVYP
jgi:hypothetical protein